MKSEKYFEKTDESQDNNNVLPMAILFDNLSTNSPPEANLDKEKVDCVRMFEKWPENDQVDFIQGLLPKMSHIQQSQINTYLSPMLQRDFISLLPKKGLDHVAEKILVYLDGKSLCNAELVCKEWLRIISDSMLWKKLIEYNVKNNFLWRELSKRRGWAVYLFKTNDLEQKPDHFFYRRLYPQIIIDIENMESNWRNGRHTLQKINCRSEVSKGVYCLQYDDKQIVSGLRDNTIKIWSRQDLECKRILIGHTGSVLCLQYDDKVIISGSSDATVRVWDVETGILKNTLIHHSEAVLHLRFNNRLMVTCSKDRSIAVWDMRSPIDIILRRVLIGHRAAVNVVDFDEKYIVSASGDRTIKVWKTSTCEFVRTLMGHKRGIACLQYRDRLVVSGSSDNTIRLWDIELGNCLRILEGHEELVRCIRFDNKRIVSGAYDGKIKVWDLPAALDPKTKENSFCLKTFSVHTGRVFRLQFDEFQIVSSSHDDTILIWDFLGSEHSVQYPTLPLNRRGNNNDNSSNSNDAKSRHNSMNNGGDNATTSRNNRNTNNTFNSNGTFNNGRNNNYNNSLVEQVINNNSTGENKINSNLNDPSSFYHSNLLENTSRIVDQEMKNTETVFQNHSKFSTLGLKQMKLDLDTNLDIQKSFSLCFKQKKDEQEQNYLNQSNSDVFNLINTYRNENSLSDLDMISSFHNHKLNNLKNNHVGLSCVNSNNEDAASNSRNNIIKNELPLFSFP